MRKRSLKLFFTVLIASVAFFTLNAFTKAPGKSMLTGGGYTTEGQFFNLNAIENNGQVEGRVNFDGSLYEVASVVTEGPYVTLYLNDDQYIIIMDGGEGSNGIDLISEVQQISEGNNACEDVIQRAKLMSVEGGNIQVHGKFTDVSTLRRPIKR